MEITELKEAKLPSRSHLKLYSKTSVYEESLNRIRYLFDEFDQVVVSFSGGKDSTVIFNIALIVAREKNRLPLQVMFIDQESELESTVTMVRHVMNLPEVFPRWYQIPFKLFNATSTIDHWLMCWDQSEEYRWMRPKEPCAIKQNIYGTDRFKELFESILAVDFKGKRVCCIGGVRCEESPGRMLGMTYDLTYKHITWGKRFKNGDHFTFYPIYDWCFSDVWKAIHDNGWPYSTHYDSMYRYGVPLRGMRVSSLMHETAVTNLFTLQQIEPDTYERLTQRIQGIDMAAKMSHDYFPKKLPFMFTSWTEYRDYLLDHLIDNAAWKKKFKASFFKQEKIYKTVFGDELIKVQISSILTNDWEGVKMHNFTNSSRKVRNARYVYDKSQP